MNIKYKNQLLEEVSEYDLYLVELCQKLIQIPSYTPPSDTREIASFLVNELKNIPGIELSLYSPPEDNRIVNIVAKIKGCAPGERLIFNGHVDTHVIGDESKWTYSPLKGEIVGDRIYGRGSSDMKSGIAALVTALHVLAKHRDNWKGEVVATIVGAEEMGGFLGTKYLIENVSDAVGDAVICCDCGAPEVLRFGEKGIITFNITAHGIAAHAAHRYKGDCANVKLVRALSDLYEMFQSYKVTIPKEIDYYIEKSKDISESKCGEKETVTLKIPTINFGIINGGLGSSLMSDYAECKGDVRLPAGATVEEALSKVNDVIKKHPGVDFIPTSTIEPNWSNPEGRIALILHDVSEYVLQSPVAINYRIGATDGRHYRVAGMPVINCGLTPNNMGGTDEYASVSEMKKMAKIYLLSAMEYLSI